MVTVLALFFNKSNFYFYDFIKEEHILFHRLEKYSVSKNIDSVVEPIGLLSHFITRPKLVHMAKKQCSHSRKKRGSH